MKFILLMAVFLCMVGCEEERDPIEVGKCYVNNFDTDDIIKIIGKEETMDSLDIKVINYDQYSDGTVYRYDAMSYGTIFLHYKRKVACKFFQDLQKLYEEQEQKKRIDQMDDRINALEDRLGRK